MASSFVPNPADTTSVAEQELNWNLQLAHVFYRINLVLANGSSASEVEVNSGLTPRVIRDYFNAQPGCAVTASQSRPGKLKITWSVGNPPQCPQTALYRRAEAGIPAIVAAAAIVARSVLSNPPPLS